MAHVGVLRAGYGAFALAFAAFAGAAYAGGLTLVALLLALVGGVLLAFSDDDLPKWAGLALVAYFGLTALAFLATTPITIHSGGSSYYFAPPDLATLVIFGMGLVSPLVLAGAGIVATWERERAPRLLLMGAALGFVVVAAFTLTLTPDLDPECAADPNRSGCEGAAAEAAAQAQRQGGLIGILFALSGACGLGGCAWAAARPQEID